MKKQSVVTPAVSVYIVAPKTKEELDALADRSFRGEIKGLILEQSINLVGARSKESAKENIRRLCDSFGKVYLNSETPSPNESSELSEMQAIFLKNCASWNLWTLEKLKMLHTTYQRNSIKKVMHGANFPCFHIGFAGDPEEYEKSKDWGENKVIHGPDKGKRLSEVVNEFNSLPETILVLPEASRDFSVRMSYYPGWSDEIFKLETGMFFLEDMYSRKEGYHR